MEQDFYFNFGRLLTIPEGTKFQTNIDIGTFVRITGKY